MSRPPRRRFFFWLKCLAGLFIALVLVGVIAVVWIIRATQQVPEFYAQAVEIPAARAAEAGDRLERQVVELRNEVQNDDRFQMTFTADEINGWLASDLGEKFPEALPGTIHDPRVKFEEQTAVVAFRLVDGKASTVVTIRAEVGLLEGEDMLAVRLRGLHAGTVPVPIGPLLEKARHETEQRNLPIRWEEDGGDPVMLIPLRLGDQLVKDRQIVLESVHIAPQGITISGRAIEVPPPEKIDDQ